LKFRRSALIAIVVLTSLTLVDASSRAVTTAPTKGLPLYQFVNSGVEPLPWNAVSLESQLSSTTMLGGPHGATDATEGVLAYRTNTNELATLTKTAAGATQWSDLSSGNDVATPAADPIPFFDPSGDADLLYVDTSGDVQLLSPNEPDTKLWARLHFGTPWRPFVTTNLTALTGVAATVGLPSIAVSGTTATVAYRSASDAIEVLTLSWETGDPIPVFGQSDVTVTSIGGATSPTALASPTTTTSTTATSTTSTTTTTTPPATTTGFRTDPIVLPGLTPGFATTLANGDLVVFSNSGTSIDAWTSQNLTTSSGTPTIVGPLALGTSTSAIDLVGLTAAGSVELYSSFYLSATPAVTPHAKVVSVGNWTVENLTTAAAGAPPLTGQLAVEVTPSEVAVAGEAANWGDLFVLSAPAGSNSWSSTNVSVTAGSGARTVANIVAGLTVSGELTLYAAGLASPPPQGVGVYAIPSAKWSAAITAGWPIISETGGLGTRSAPWVGFTGNATVATSPDFLLGQAIYNSHKRVTWLSFWTVSGPLASEPQTTATYYAHGYAAGVWVATQIDSYRALGVGLKPDWVILDPEGYPDNHSGLDAPSGSSTATMAKYATYWSSMLSGWQLGLQSVDSSLNAGVYTEQSEYRNYQLSSLTMPVFMAIAFGGSGPTLISGASGSNVRGFISFGASCTPASTLQSEAATLLNPPWSGQFNTLQFNPGIYCAPPET
jgi:hypothetical protein